MSAEEIRKNVGGAWAERADGFWLDVQASRVREVAAAMRTGSTRFAALVARPAGDGLRLSWHWDDAGTLLSIVADLAPGEEAPSVVDIWPGADWAERETREYYAVAFAGRADTAPLMLRDGDEPGVMLPGRGEGR